MDIYDEINGDGYEEPDEWERVESLRLAATVGAAVTTFDAADVMFLIEFIDDLASDVKATTAEEERLRGGIVSIIRMWGHGHRSDEPPIKIREEDEVPADETSWHFIMCDLKALLNPSTEKPT